MEKKIPKFFWMQHGSIWFRLKHMFKWTWMMIKKDYLLKKRIKKVQKFVSTQDKEQIEQSVLAYYQLNEIERELEI